MSRYRSTETLEEEMAGRPSIAWLVLLFALAASVSCASVALAQDVPPEIQSILYGPVPSDTLTYWNGTVRYTYRGDGYVVQTWATPPSDVFMLRANIDGEFWAKNMADDDVYMVNDTMRAVYNAVVQWPDTTLATQLHYILRRRSVMAERLENFIDDLTVLRYLERGQ